MTERAFGLRNLTEFVAPFLPWIGIAILRSSSRSLGGPGPRGSRITAPAGRRSRTPRNVSVTIVDGPAIVGGYSYRLQIEAETPRSSRRERFSWRRSGPGSRPRQQSRRSPLLMADSCKCRTPCSSWRSRPRRPLASAPAHHRFLLGQHLRMIEESEAAQAAEALGHDIEDVYAQRAREKAMRETYGLPEDQHQGISTGPSE